MKRLVILFIFFCSFAAAQRNELKINLIKLMDVSYERKLSPRFSAGIHLGTGLFPNDDLQNRLFLKGFGRLYIMKNQDFNKLFLQASFIMRRDEYFPPSAPNTSQFVGKKNETGITGGFGYKFLIKNNFVIDLYIDAGPEFNHPDEMLPFIFDAGLNLGYRF